MAAMMLLLMLSIVLAILIPSVVFVYFEVVNESGIKWKSIGVALILNLYILAFISGHELYGVWVNII